jgi:osmotically-inducible protein OsmY
MAAEELIRSPDDLSDDDDRLVREIRRTLLAYEPLRSTRPLLEVGVEDGRVSLGGRMRTGAMKEIAEYLLLRVSGVRAVRNEVVTDPEVVRAVADALASDDRLGPLCIQVEARNGQVVLSGAVPDESSAARAREIAAGVPTVADVQSALLVRPEVAAGSNGAADTAPSPHGGVLPQADTEGDGARGDRPSGQSPEARG